MVTDDQVAADLTLTSTGTEDSTDAYAGTFLSAVAATYDATPSSSRRARLAGIAGARRWEPVQPKVVAVLHGLTDPSAARAQLAAEGG